MTPKEKAKELFNRYQNEVGMYRFDAMQCALIAVDEIIKIFEDTNGSHYRLEYWEEVKLELKKL